MGVLVNPFWASGYSGTLLDGLISWWDMDEASGTRVDSHNGYNLAGGSEPGSTTGHVSALAADFDGTNENLTRSADSLATNEGTIAVWVKQDVDESAVWILHVGAAIAGEVEIYTSNASGQLRAFLRVENDVSPCLTVTGLKAYNVWNCIIGTWTSTVGTVYMNDGTGTSSSADPTYGGIDTGSTFTVGERFTSGQNFDGQIGPMALWNRVLTSDERAEFYNSGAGFPYPGP